MIEEQRRMRKEGRMFAERKYKSRDVHVYLELRREKEKGEKKRIGTFMVSYRGSLSLAII